MDSYLEADARNVFVVHGRNDGARRAMFTFLRSINLNPLEWPKIVSATIEQTGEQNPYIGAILSTGFSLARAAVVLSTPDDEVRLKMEFWLDSDGDHEKQFNGQARQNVTFEAGLALGKHEKQTVIVELGRVKPMSDTIGRHVVRMDNSIERRQELAQRLQSAGCTVDLGGTDWHSEGDFEAAIAGDASPDTSSVDSPVSESPATAPAVKDDLENSPAAKHRVTASNLINVGEHLWYLSNPPRASVSNIIQAIRGFLSKLDECGLPMTRAAANGLSRMNLNYDARSGIITPISMRDLAVMMESVRGSLNAEVALKDEAS